MRVCLPILSIFFSVGVAFGGNDVKGIGFTVAEGEPLCLDIHYPDKAQSSYPVVLWIHGGGWRQGSRANWTLLDWLPAEGYAVVSIDYRLTDKAIFPAQIEDCAAALQWIGKHAVDFRLNPDKITISGLSAGAHLATLLGVSGSHFVLTGAELPPIRGIMHFYGPCDFISMTRYARKPDDTLNTPESPVYALLGGPLREKGELAKAASPVTYLDSGDPPILILVGTEDSKMTQRQCARLEAAATEAGIQAALHRVEGAGHGGTHFKDAARKKIILDFLHSL